MFSKITIGDDKGVYNDCVRNFSTIANIISVCSENMVCSG